MSTAIGHGLVDPKRRGKPVLANKVGRVLSRALGIRRGATPSACQDWENQGHRPLRIERESG